MTEADGEHSENNRLSGMQTLTRTSSYQLQHGLPFGTLKISAGNSA